MGTSAKKKKERQKDFKKAKLKVGKTAALPDNHTSTAFRAKALLLPAQTLVQSIDTTDQFDRHLGLLDSKSDATRKDSLTFLTHCLTTTNTLPRPIPFFFPRLQGLVLDRSTGVRNQLIKLLHALPAQEVREYCATYKCPPLLLILTGMSHLSMEVRSSSLDAFEWLISIAGDIVVTCPGGWVRTINHFLTLLKWSIDPKTGKLESKAAGMSARLNSGGGSNKPGTISTITGGGAAATAALFGRSDTESRIAAKTLRILAALLQVGFKDESEQLMEQDIVNRQAWFPVFGGGHDLFLMPGVPNMFGPLGLFDIGTGTGIGTGSGGVGGNGSGNGVNGGSTAEDEKETLENGQFLQRTERQAAFVRSRAAEAVAAGMAITKPVGGEIGRTAVLVERAVTAGMNGYEIVGMC